MLLPIALMSATLQFQIATPPVAPKVPHETVLHGDKLIDDYDWLRQKSDKKVIDYLNAENAYSDAVMKDTVALQDSLYSELLSRIKQTDLSVPYMYRGWMYYTRTEEGKQYQIYCRKRNQNAPEEILLDVNKLAEGEKFMSISSFEVSPDGKLLAFNVDNTGFRQYKLRCQRPPNPRSYPLRMSALPAWNGLRITYIILQYRR